MSEKKGFVHLHTHTEYSLLDGMNKITNYVTRVKELGQTAAAITDHGNMFGVITFYQECKKQGIKPIIGCEVYVCEDMSQKTRDYFHLVLLCENNKGYENLVKLVSLSNSDGFYYKPRIDKKTLKRYHEGLIASSACIAGEIAKACLESKEDAKETILEYIDIFGKDNFFLELQDHKDGSIEQQKVNSLLLELSKEMNIPVIATNDAHYTLKEDADAHEILLCMQTGKKLSEEHMVYKGGQYYIKSEEEMLSLFPHCKEAIWNTQTIADRCNVTLLFAQEDGGSYHLPPFKLPEGFNTTKEFLRHLTCEGFKKKFLNNDEYTEERAKEIWEDVECELKTIDSMGFNEYILIVWDYINWSRNHDCEIGPGRGSAAGSKVCYCIGITDIDPVKYGLLFSRFLNPERVSMPDIDVDFEDTERQRVIDDYICPHYGADKVSQITTFQNLKTRAVLKDSGKVLDIPYSVTDHVAKMVPKELKMTLDKALEMNPELKAFYEENEEHKKWFDFARRLEGLPKSTSLHAAGVVIYPKKANECMPQARSKEGLIGCQYNMVQLEELGYLKMDFLGLRTLSVIKNTVKNVKKSMGIDVDIKSIDLNDKYVLDFIGTGKTCGVFQLESNGMQSFMKELKPQNFEDIIAGVSLYRPGPMDFIPAYIKGKNNSEDIEYACPELEPILSPTYGCIVYQEQVMRIVQDLAGYSAGGADNIRRAMSKFFARLCGNI